MSSRKLTALPTATEVTTSDKIYIVDVSDTTESPQGTSKQATVEKVINSMPSGSFAPTISNISNDATVDNVVGIYSRAGGVVTGMFSCDVTLETGSNSTSFEFSLPVLTDFANRNQLLCTSNIVANLVEVIGDAIISESKGTVSITAANNGDSLQRLTICYQYLIV